VLDFQTDPKGAISTQNMSIHQVSIINSRIVCRMELDLVMRKFANFDCGHGTMFTFCTHVASRYVGLTVIGAKRNPST